MSVVRLGVAALAALALTGCPGGLDEDEFADCPPGFVEGAIFEAQCSGCHSAAVPTAGLDFETPDPAPRMIDVAGTDNCGQTLVINSADPLASLLLDKVSDAPSCGQPMPPSTILSQRELACLRRWVQDAVASESSSLGERVPEAVEFAGELADGVAVGRDQ